jgi:hypothetical protein
MRNHDTALSRRRLLEVAWMSAGVLAYPGAASSTALPTLEREESPFRSRPYNGSADPYPIPWLDKNGSHNQMAGPNVELSHIYHFKGKIARCNGFRARSLTFD